MKPTSAVKRFLARIERDESSLQSLLPADGIEAMLAFYSEERAQGCSLDDDGDMLLYQWGTHDWGEGEAFELDITRQFIDAKRVIRQLSLRFKFAVTNETRAAGDSNRWCELLDEVDGFRRFILASKAYKLVKSLTPTSVALKLTQP